MIDIQIKLFQEHMSMNSPLSIDTFHCSEVVPIYDDVPMLFRNHKKYWKNQKDLDYVRKMNKI